MLIRLTVKDYVLIDLIELDVDAGFTVLTGETGAGKSIILGAISLILGGRSDAGSIRAGASRILLRNSTYQNYLMSILFWMRLI